MPIKLRAVQIRIFCAPRASGTGIAGRPKTFYRPNVRIMLAEGAVEVTGRCPRMDRYGPRFGEGRDGLLPASRQ